MSTDKTVVLWDTPTTKARQHDLVVSLTQLTPTDFVESIPQWSLENLGEAGTGLIQFYDRLESTKAEVLKAVAKVVVAIRSKFRDSDGAPDWRGRSWEYRQFIGRVYEAAGIPAESQAASCQSPTS